MATCGQKWFHNNNDNDKHTAQLLKRRIHYSIHKVKLNQAAKLGRVKKAKDKALLKEHSLPDKVANARAPAIKAAAKKEKRIQ